MLQGLPDSYRGLGGVIKCTIFLERYRWYVVAFPPGGGRTIRSYCARPVTLSPSISLRWACRSAVSASIPNAGWCY